MDDLTGLAAIGIAFFPMSPAFAQEFKQRGPIGYHHYFVVTFFVMAIVMVWRFTAHTPANPTQEKIRRNWIYRICAAIMALACIFIAFLGFSRNGHAIFWPETAAVVSFGIAWLVKGQTILKDPRVAVRV